MKKFNKLVEVFKSLMPTLFAFRRLMPIRIMDINRDRFKSRIFTEADGPPF
jgi:hypothetical protein